MVEDDARRGDYYDASVKSLFDSNNSGHVSAAIGRPKFRTVVGPFNQTELFVGAGLGMHSNDARGATITEEPTDPIMKLSASPLLVRTKGAEVGVRSRIVPGLDTSISFFLLDQASEMVFNGDAGDTSGSRPRRRYGVEWTNKYRPNSWLTVDAELAVTHTRFLGYDSDQATVYASLAGFPQAQIGNALGNYIPNAPAMVASAGITLGENTACLEACVGATSLQVHSLNTMASVRPRRASSTRMWVTATTMAGESSSISSIC